jgi:hypothetical protein
MNKINNSIHTNIQGFYRVSVVDKDSKIIWEQPDSQKNLILNQGMDALATYPFQQCMLYGYCGQGTRQNSIYSGVDTVASQSGTSITLVPGSTLTSFTQSAGGFSSALSAGDVLVWDTGSGGTTEVTVASVDNLTCVVGTSLTIASPGQPFTIWKTSQQGLQLMKYSAGTGVSGSTWTSGYCGSGYSGNRMRLFRTFDFQTQSIGETFTELGVGWNLNSYNQYVFSRILMNTPVTISAAQRLRVAYEMYIDCMPSASTYRTSIPITGWPVAPATNTNATESIQVFTDALAIEGITSTGPGVNANAGAVLDPMSSGNPCSAWITNDGTPLAAFGSYVTRTAGAVVAGTSLAAYPGAGSYYRDKTVTFTLAQINSTNIGSFGLGYGVAPTNANTAGQVLALRFEQSQSKFSTQTLTLSWRFTWGRTLSNGSV